MRLTGPHLSCFLRSKGAHYSGNKSVLVARILASWTRQEANTYWRAERLDTTAQATAKLKSYGAVMGAAMEEEEREVDTEIQIERGGTEGDKKLGW
mmetsp:Transcript_8160/g.18631  ORF Transcript_8160/g.18631 Transcript_8160/m.18631 type:complete len:96 (+) Transcript_8160:2458-2745(+)